jgi:hypothetical protein
VGEVFDQLFAGSSMGAGVSRVLRHGSLVTGELLGPRYTRDGIAIPRPSWIAPPSNEVTRPIESRATARLLACLLIHLERIDPKSGKACGTILWQGNTARRLGLSLRDRGDGNPYGAREVQRYVRLYARGEVLRVTQPNAEHVPEHMRAGKKDSGVWAYNVIGICDALPPTIKLALEQWRGILVKAPLQLARAATQAIDYATDAETIEGARAVLALLRGRAPDLPI